LSSKTKKAIAEEVAKKKAEAKADEPKIEKTFDEPETEKSDLMKKLDKMSN
jgi:hypothetical protein